MKLNELVESVTFSLDKRDDNEQFSDIMNMCYFASRIFYDKTKGLKPFLYKYFESNRKFVKFEPDGDDYDQPTGTINVYTENIFSNDHFKDDFYEMLNIVISELMRHVKVGNITTEGVKTSWEGPRKKFNDGDSFSSVGVVRIPILENNVETAGYQELNIANANARTLLQILGLESEDLSGSIPYNQIPKLMMKIRNLSSDTIASGERETTTSQSTRIDKENGDSKIVRGPTIHSMGLDSDRINMYLKNLLIILQQAIEHKVDVVYG